MATRQLNLIKKGVSNPDMVLKTLNIKYNNKETELVSRYNKFRIGPEACDVMGEEWDNLILLDACRYDYFAAQNSIEGELKKKIAGGSDSWGFMQHNFIDRNLHDTVYVTANPHVDRIPDGVFFKIKNTLDKWDSEIEVVHPKAIVDAARSAHESYPNKRLIIHFMQPHTPWLGAVADDIRSQFNVKGNNKNHGKAEIGVNTEDPRNGDVGWFELVKRGDVSRDEMKQAYRETLDVVLEYTDELVNNISGKSVITSDHGEMLGERMGLTRRYGHFSDDYWTEELRCVPWLETQSENRREVVEEKPEERTRMDENTVEDRLQALGYK